MATSSTEGPLGADVAMWTIAAICFDESVVRLQGSAVIFLEKGESLSEGTREDLNGVKMSEDPTGPSESATSRDHEERLLSTDWTAGLRLNRFRLLAQPTNLQRCYP